ncbi:DNA adenine methylase [Candidatus Poribacteria bacterium]
MNPNSKKKIWSLILKMPNHRKSINPAIKWSGSKRKIAPIIADMLPACTHYYEPFVGSGAMLPFRTSRTGVAGDVIGELVELWKMIRDKPELTADEYGKRWNRLQSEGHTAYYDIRDSFNANRDAHDFLFLTRTCVNGLIRFNRAREFNNSLHHTRPGISPSSLRKIIYQWSRITQGIDFITSDYRETLASTGIDDLVFLDPPYGGTKGRYIPDEFDLDEFYMELERLNDIGAKWVLTFDGEAGNRSYNTHIPPELYKTKLSLATGNSPFTKLMRTGIDKVLESVYLNFEPSYELSGQTMDFGENGTDATATLDMQLRFPC